MAVAHVIRPEPDPPPPPTIHLELTPEEAGAVAGALGRIYGRAPTNTVFNRLHDLILEHKDDLPELARAYEDAYLDLHFSPPGDRSASLEMNFD